MSLENQNCGKFTKLNDAILYGNFETPEVESLLARRFDVLVGLTAKQRAGTWRKWSPTLEDLIHRKFLNHPETSEKDGHAIVFASGVENGQFVTLADSDEQLPLSGRTQADIKAVTFAAFDIDGGTNLDDVIQTIKELGYFAIVYTTHSHFKTESWITSGLAYEGEWDEEEALFEAMIDGSLPNPTSVVRIVPKDELECGRALIAHDPIHKFRVLFPLAAPFELKPSVPSEHAHLAWEWSERLLQFSRSVLGLEADMACFDVNRIFYTPRHIPGAAEWYIGIFAGRALSVDEMPFAEIEDRIHDTRKARKLSHGRHTFKGPRPILSNGFDLIDWKCDWGDRFQITRFLEDLDWDIRRQKSWTEAIVECPNDGNHSNPGDRRDMGCWCKDGDVGSFALYCHHNACSELGSLEMLQIIEQTLEAPDEFATLSEMLCDGHYYSQCDDFQIVPHHDSYLRWDSDKDLEEEGQ